MDLTGMRVASTVLSFVAFVGIWIWAFAPRNRRSFEQAAWLPLDPESNEELS